MSQKRLNILVASLKDAPILAEIGERTFRRTYQRYNRPEDMDAYVSTHFTQEKIEQQLEDPGVTFLMAKQEQKVIGYVKLRLKSPPLPYALPKAVELERIYVQYSAIGKGRGSSLMQAALTEADHHGYKTIWLGVWEKNERAIRFYERWRFQVVGSRIFVLGSDRQNDFVMARPVIFD